MKTTARSIMIGGIAAGFLAGYYLSKKKKTKFSYQGKVVVITGGSRGLGIVIARQLAKEGAILALIARNPLDLQKAQGEISAITPQVAIYPCDVSKKQQVEITIEKIIGDLGRIDVVFNIAGTIQAGPVQNLSYEDFVASMNTNFWGPVNMTFSVLPRMREHRKGKIINISSVGGKIAIPHLLPYSCGKFALTAFSEGMQAEVSQDGISITTICPGLMRTGSHRNIVVKGKQKEEYTWFTLMNAIPLFSVEVNKSAKKIIEAGRKGRNMVVFPLYAQWAGAFHGLAPGFFIEIMQWVNSLLPSYQGGSELPKFGFESETPLTQSFLTSLIQKAAKENNEMNN